MDSARTPRRLVGLALSLALLTGAAQLGDMQLAAQQREAGEALVVRARASAMLDLLPHMKPAARQALVERLSEEVGQRPGTQGGAEGRPVRRLETAIRACSQGARACKEASEGVVRARTELNRRVERLTRMRVALDVAIALLALSLGGFLVWRSPGRTWAVALLAVLTAAGAASLRLHGALAEQQRIEQARAVGALVARARVALSLPVKARAAALHHVAEGAPHLEEIPPAVRRGVTRAARECAESRRPGPGVCSRVLLELAGLIRARPTIGSPPSLAWLLRWMAWIGAALFLIVPAAVVRVRESASRSR